MPRFLIGFCVLSWYCIFSVTAQQPAPREPFSFTPGQSVWVVADELPPRYFQIILLKSLAPGGNVKGVPGVSFREPILACGSDEQVLQACSKIEAFTPSQSPSNRTGPERQTLDGPLPQRPTLDPDPVAMPAWTVSPNPNIKKAVEEEFQKQKKFKVAASAETADFILWLLIIPVPDEMMMRGQVFGAPSKNDYLLRHVLALAVPPQLYSRKQQEFQALTGPALGEMMDAQLQKQQQVRALMKDLPWRGVALGTGRGVTTRNSPQGISLESLITCFHKEALKKKP